MIEVVNSVNPVRIEGQKTAAFEIVDVLGDAPDVHCLPVGNAGNITAYWKGYCEYAELGNTTHRPAHARLAGVGRGADRAGRAGAAPRDDRDRDPDRQPGVAGTRRSTARDESGGHIGEVTDAEILEAYRMLAGEEGVFVEPASAASVAGLLAASRQGLVRAGETRRVHRHRATGSKDPQRAISEVEVSVTVEATAAAVADAVGF